MLRELSVQNLALIEDARVELSAGYCAWTGETGAGKSLLLTALTLVLGGKASADWVRSGKSEARAAAVFDVSEPSLRDDVETILGVAVEDGELIVTRRILAQGRGSAQANGLPVTVATLQALGARLVDLHGQHEGRALVDPDHQRALLDAHGGLAPRVEEFNRLRDEFDVLRRRRRELLQKADDRRRERALLEFERDELTALDPQPGEPADLAHEAHRLANVGAIRELSTRGYARLYDVECSAQEVLASVAQSLTPLADSVPHFNDAAETLERLAEEAREVAYNLRSFSQTLDDDPDRLEEVETRLAHYRRLAVRFRAPDELAVTRSAVETRLATLDQDDADLSGLDAPLAESRAALDAAAATLTAARRQAAKAFARAVRSRLKPLGLEGARLDVEIETNPIGDDTAAAPPPTGGADRVEIVFAANPGEALRPLRKTASGGELSRVTLAVKAVLAGADRVPTLVFDEIDTGVGGRLGATLGRTLAGLARHHQVLCVTHLPQLASYAHAQWVIRKHVTKGRTRTTITPLGDTDRADEIAAMLRGDSADDSTRREALAMLLEARTAR